MEATQFIKDGGLATRSGNSYSAAGPSKWRQLAERAKDRRKAIGMKRPELVRLTGMSPEKVISVERTMPSTPDPVLEAKWEDALFVPRGWLRDVSLPVIDIQGTAGQECELPPCKNAAEEILAISMWLANPNRNRRAFVNYALGKSERRAADMFARRYGIAGAGSSSLQAIGDHYGVTRERIRQVVSMLHSRARGLVVQTPRIDAVMDQYSQYVPAKLSSIDASLRDLLGDNLSLIDLSAFVREVLGREGVNFSRCRDADGAASGDHYVTLPGFDSQFVAAVRSCSLRMIRQTGAAHVLTMVGAVSAELDRAVSVAEVEKALRVTSGFEWLIEDEGWYWLGAATENRLITVARKLLVTSANPMDTHDVAAALSRNRREGCEERKRTTYTIEPPAIVVGEVLSRHDEFRVFQYSFVELRTPVPYQSVIPDNEAVVVRYIQDNGGVASRVAMSRDLVDTGIIKSPTLHAALGCAPSICRLERGVFSIAGQRINASALSRAQEESGDRVGRRGMEDGPMSDDGFVSVRCTVKHVMLGSTFVTAPIVIGKFLEDGYYTLDGSSRQLRCKANQFEAMRIYGLPDVLVDFGMGVGTPFVLSVNPKTKTFRILKAQQ